jgi:Glycosyl transferases group 1
MEINLIGKFSNAWGAEHLVKAGFGALGHTVHAFELRHSYRILREIKTGCLTIVMQGYGMAPKLIEAGRRLTNYPWVLWHAEVMSPEWPTDDEVVIGKAQQLAQNAYAFDAIGHNCHCCLTTVERIRDRLRPEREGGKPVFWAPANGVSAKIHRRLPEMPKNYAIGFYGHPSPRRVEMITRLQGHGIPVDWAHPQDGMYGEQLTEFINRCHCILNLHYSETKNTECRLYEAMGCGVPVISEPISMPELFPVRALSFFNDAERLSELCEGILRISKNDPGLLADRGTDAMTWLHANASYAQRCQDFLARVMELGLCS